LQGVVLFSGEMMSVSEKNNTKVWFPAKKYGVGWGLPVTWQGWIVIFAYLVLMLGGIVFLARSPIAIPLFFAYAFVLTALFIFICWKKGEKPTFRWGKKIN
jgi:hypothetical protein